MLSEGQRREAEPETPIEARATPESTAEKSPEAVLETVISKKEQWDGSDPIFSLPWMRACTKWVSENRERAKEKYDKFAKENPKTATAGEFAVDAGRVGFVSVAKIVWGLLKFVKEMVAKKGKVGWKEGYALGKEMFSFETKKDKK